MVRALRIAGRFVVAGLLMPSFLPAYLQCRPITSSDTLSNLLIDVCPSVLRRLFFDLVDDEHGRWALLFLEFEPELLVDGVKERDGASGVGRDRCIDRGGWCGAGLNVSQRVEPQHEVVSALKVGCVEYGTLEVSRR